MQKVFNLTNKYIILATVLILYSLITNIYMAFFSLSAGVKVINIIFALFLLFLMTVAFLAGWFKMFKEAIFDEKSTSPNGLAKFFPEGVGEYFLPVLGQIFISAVVFGILLFTAVYFGNHYIGNPHLDVTKLLNINNNSVEIKNFILSLPPEQISQLVKWNNLLLCTLTSSYFLLFLYTPVLFLKNKNPFLAFFISLKDLFSKKILKNIGIFLAVFIINTFISVLSALSANNTVLSFIVTLLGFYVITASVMWVFLYYHNNFIKSHLGNNIDIKI